MNATQPTAYPFFSTETLFFFFSIRVSDKHFPFQMLFWNHFEKKKWPNFRNVKPILFAFKKWINYCVQGEKPPKGVPGVGDGTCLRQFGLLRQNSINWGLHNRHLLSCGSGAGSLRSRCWHGLWWSLSSWIAEQPPPCKEVSSHGLSLGMRKDKVLAGVSSSS